MATLEKKHFLKTIKTPILNNAFFYLGYSLTGSVFGFVFWIITARLFSSGQVGFVAALANAISLIVLIGDMGMSAAILRFIPSIIEKIDSFINSVLITTLLANLTISIVFIIGIPWWSKGLLPLRQNILYSILFIFACISFSLALDCDNIFIARQKTYLALVRAFIFNASRILLFVVLVGTKEVTSFLLSHGLASLITAIFSIFFYFPKIIQNYQPIKNISFSVLISKLRYTAGNHYTNLITSLLPILFPMIIVNLLGAKNTAYFYTSWMIANFLFMIPMGISTSAFTDSAKHSSNYVNRMLKIMWLNLLFLIPVCAAIILLSPFLFLLFGKEYVTNVGLFRLLALSVFPYTVNTFIYQIFRLKQVISLLVIFTTLTSVLSLLFVIVFSKSYGLIGIGYGWFTGQAIGAMLGLFLTFLKDKNRNILNEPSF